MDVEFAEFAVNVKSDKEKTEVTFYVDERLFEDCESDRECDQAVANEVSRRDKEIKMIAAEQLGISEKEAVDLIIDYNSISN